MKKVFKPQNINDGKLTLDYLEFRLPCREFLFEYQSVDEVHFPIMIEFLLRLIKAAKSVSDQEIKDFFRLSWEECNYVTNKIINIGYATRRDDAIFLTAVGEQLFSANNDEPSIFQYKKYRKVFGFDLISCMPVKKSYLSKFANVFEELDVSIETKKSIEEVRENLRQNFLNTLIEHNAPEDERKTLVSIDSITPRGRYAATVPTKVVLDTNDQKIEIDFTDWRTGLDFESRRKIAQSVNSAILSLPKIDVTSFQKSATALHECAPDVIEPFYGGDKFNSQKFIRKTSEGYITFQSNRKTVLTLGSFWTEENGYRIVTGLNYGIENVTENTDRGKIELKQDLYLFKPRNRTWGMTTNFEDLLQAVVDLLSEKLEIRLDINLFHQPDDPDVWKFKHVVDNVTELKPSKEFDNFEALLVPNIFCSSSILGTVFKGTNATVKMGFMSFDTNIVKNCEELAVDVIKRIDPQIAARFFKKIIRKKL
ncbi:MAG: hypothetical protein O3A32_09215 [Proteobacteria bacterium]|nr:hypothetical protein [Pseudomonadota bacterium]MDA1294916.1 hypothetical protein [Pseudomonadota bacterium]